MIVGRKCQDHEKGNGLTLEIRMALAASANLDSHPVLLKYLWDKFPLWLPKVMWGIKLGLCWRAFAFELVFMRALNT